MSGNVYQLALLDIEAVSPSQRRETEPTFLDNMRQPVHRWFRFSAGYSGQWVERLVAERQASIGLQVHDPFSGSGTTVIACDHAGVASTGIEAHPFIYQVARAKLDWHTRPADLLARSAEILACAPSCTPDVSRYPDLIRSCYPDPILGTLDRIRIAWEEQPEDTAANRLTWLALTSVLRACSPVGTANMELIQPKKNKKNFLDPTVAFEAAVSDIAADMRVTQRRREGSRGAVYHADARDCQAVPSNSVDLVVTSPPYANNFDYADAVRLEMSFWGEVRSWADLHKTIRRHLIVSCAQHATADRLELDTVLARRQLAPILDSLRPVVDELGHLRHERAGKKHYHTMIAGYLSDMADVLVELRRVCKPGAEVCMVIGDSAPYGVYAPIHQWIGQLAVSNGFESYRFEKVRDRNLKWKNRKHRVPLLEGHLWIQA